MAEHSTLLNSHSIVGFTYANQTVRLAANTFTTTDRHKIAYQDSDESYWLLTNHSPVTWRRIFN